MSRCFAGKYVGIDGSAERERPLRTAGQYMRQVSGGGGGGGGDDDDAVGTHKITPITFAESGSITPTFGRTLTSASKLLCDKETPPSNQKAFLTCKMAESFSKCTRAAGALVSINVVRTPRLLPRKGLAECGTCAENV